MYDDVTTVGEQTISLRIVQTPVLQEMIKSLVIGNRYKDHSNKASSISTLKTRRLLIYERNATHAPALARNS
ncbi:unnamed protein product, partial [Ceratitis capitata]